MKKTIEINILTLVAIFLMIIGIAMGIIAIGYYGNEKCLRDPVGYVNEHSNRYFDGDVEIIVMSLKPNAIFGEG